MLTTVENYEAFLTDSFNATINNPGQSSTYKYAFIKLKHDLAVFKEHNGYVNVPDTFFTLFLDWWDHKNKDERKSELN